MTFDFMEISQLAVAFVFGGGLSAVAAKRMLKDVTVIGAETRIVELLRDEVNRISKVNERLEKSVAQMTLENANLRTEIFDLRMEIRRLHDTETPIDFKESAIYSTYEGEERRNVSDSGFKNVP